MTAWSSSVSTATTTPRSGLAFARHSGVSFAVGANADSALAPRFTLFGYPGTVFIDALGGDRQDRARPGEPRHPRELRGAPVPHLTRSTHTRHADPRDAPAPWDAGVRWRRRRSAG